MELIDYIDHVDDPIVLEKISPLYKKNGLPPTDPRTYFHMHSLYFTMPEKTPYLSDRSISLYLEKILLFR